jgi:methionyl-tRNA synthetase
MVDQLKAFNWVTWYGGKFSTSMKRGIFMDQALELLPADNWRWKLMANAPESADSAFTLADFKNGVNSDLGNVFGNFINRIVRFTESKFDGTVPDGGTWGEAEEKLADALDERLEDLLKYHEAMEFRKAAGETRAIWGLANEYLTVAAPWTAIKTDQNAAAIGVRTGLNLCVLCATIAAPFIPGSATKVLEAFGITAVSWPDRTTKDILTRLKPGTKIGAVPVLFPRIEDGQVTEWEVKFGAPGL